jgi:hypothetical protein
LSVASVFQAVGRRWREVKATPFSPAHAAYCFPAVAHAAATAAFHEWLLETRVAGDAHPPPSGPLLLLNFVLCVAGEASAEKSEAAPKYQGRQGCGRSGSREGPAQRSARPPQSPSAAEAGLASEASTKKMPVCGLSGSQEGCRGETPRTPPAAGEVAHVRGRTCASEVADPHMCEVADPHVCERSIRTCPLTLPRGWRCCP